jgi:myo-inositol 2-dehydrogenase / D-chiro-inositol 1-dehydrogenase
LVDPEIGRAGDIDTAVISMRFKNGALGTIQNSRKAVYGYDQRIEIFGSLGKANLENLLENSVQLNRKAGTEIAKPLYFFLERYEQSYETEMSMFVESLQKGIPSPMPGEEARYPVVAAIAAQKSLWEGRTIKLSEIE